MVPHVGLHNVTHLCGVALPAHYYLQVVPAFTHTQLRVPTRADLPTASCGYHPAVHMRFRYGLDTTVRFLPTGDARLQRHDAAHYLHCPPRLLHFNIYKRTRFAGSLLIHRLRTGWMVTLVPARSTPRRHTRDIRLPSPCPLLHRLISHGCYLCYHRTRTPSRYLRFISRTHGYRARVYRTRRDLRLYAPRDPAFHTYGLLPRAHLLPTAHYTDYTVLLPSVFLPCAAVAPHTAAPPAHTLVIPLPAVSHRGLPRAHAVVLRAAPHGCCALPARYGSCMWARYATDTPRAPTTHRFYTYPHLFLYRTHRAALPFTRLLLVSAMPGYGLPPQQPTLRSAFLWFYALFGCYLP